MTPKAFARKRPTGRGSFSYARLTDRPGVVVYRLCRRDERGAHHYESHAFAIEAPRAHIAAVLLDARRRLRDTVDEIDLALMGVTQ